MFDRAQDAPAAAEDEASKAAEEAAKDPTKFGSKKSKAAAKTGTAATQWGIMKQSGLTDEEIPAFRCGLGYACTCADAFVMLVLFSIAAFVH